MIIIFNSMSIWLEHLSILFFHIDKHILEITLQNILKYFFANFIILAELILESHKHIIHLI